jgi:hypothetical protein
MRGSGVQDRKIVRVDDTVRRPSGPWTDSVHQLLRHIREHGFDLAPEPWYDTGHLAWFTVPLMDNRRARARGFPARPARLARLDAFAAGAGLTRARVLEAALAAQAEYERRVVSRGRGGGSWAPFYQAGLHENAARDRSWTAAEFRQFRADGGLPAGPPG